MPDQDQNQIVISNIKLKVFDKGSKSASLELEVDGVHQSFNQDVRFKDGRPAGSPFLKDFSINVVRTGNDIDNGFFHQWFNEQNGKRNLDIELYDGEALIHTIKLEECYLVGLENYFSSQGDNGYGMVDQLRVSPLSVTNGNTTFSRN